MTTSPRRRTWPSRRRCSARDRAGRRPARSRCASTATTVVGSLPLGVQRRVAFAQALAAPAGPAHPGRADLGRGPAGPGPAVGDDRRRGRGRARGSWSPPTTWTRPGSAAGWSSWRTGGWWPSGTARGDHRGRPGQRGGGGRWAAAFGALEAAGLPAALVGPHVAGAGRRAGRGAPRARAACPPGERGPGHPGRALLPAHRGRARGADGSVTGGGQRGGPGAGAGTAAPGRRSWPPARKRFAESRLRRRHDPRHRRRRRRGPGPGASLLRHQGAPVRGGHAAAAGARASCSARRSRPGPADPARSLGEHLVRTVLGAWDVNEIRDAFLGLLRSATTSEQAAAMLREFVTEAILGRLAEAAGRDGGGRGGVPGGAGRQPGARPGR